MAFIFYALSVYVLWSIQVYPVYSICEFKMWSFCVLINCDESSGVLIYKK
jgi:hypothetical protein